ncbi:MAG: right-handed parallel beta-helix repeat-containing protein, partial [Chitinophagaceae bacterium]|nr:right-handed parallel beta-helix repeat-containing protein [Anaerolineae bacterium]
MKKVIIILLCLLTLMTVNRQSAMAATESDTETFLATNFDLQSAYTRVLCVQQAAPCPGSINTAVPCLTIGCANVPQNYNIHSTYGTIQAASNAALAGDLIIIMPGTYAGVEVEEKHGANNAYIHFLGWGTPGSIIVNNPAPGTTWRHHFYFIDTNYYIIQNIAFQNATEGAGIYFSGYFNYTGHFSHHLIVLNVYSHDNFKWGLHTTQASYMVIQDSVFTGSTDEHGAYISGGGDHFLIRRNVFQGNNASGLQVNADPQTATAELLAYLENLPDPINTCDYTEADLDHPVYATWHQIKACYDSQGLPNLGEYIDDGISQDLIIEQNVMTGNGELGGGAINLASVRNSIVRNNLVYGNQAGSITCWDNNYAADKNLASSVFGCDNVRVVNNTVMETAVEPQRSAVVFTNDARNMTVYNNIIVRPRDDAYEISARSGTGLRSGANYYYRLEYVNSPGYITIDTSPGSGSVTNFTIPQAQANFVSPNNNNWVNLGGAWPQANPNRPDFRLKPTSALISMANPTYRPNTDYLGNVRVGNSIGALDVSDGSGGPIGMSAPTGTINTPYGNPNYVWNDNGADTYEFYLDNSINDGTAQYTVAGLTDDAYCNGTTCTFDPVGLSETARLIDGGYVVYLRGTINGLPGALAGPFTFSLDAPPPVPVTFNPPTGTNTLRPTFSWSLSGNAIYSNSFRLFLIKKALFDAGNYTPTVDLWFSRTQVCT